MNLCRHKVSGYFVRKVNNIAAFTWGAGASFETQAQAKTALDNYLNGRKDRNQLTVTITGDNQP